MKNLFLILAVFISSYGCSAKQVKTHCQGKCGEPCFKIKCEDGKCTRIKVCKCKDCSCDCCKDK